MSDNPAYSQSGGQDDGYIEPQPRGDPAATPELQQFRNLPWPPEAQPFADEMAIRLNDYDQRTRIGQANAQAGQNYRNNALSFAGSLVNATVADPHFADTAISLVRPAFDALISSNPTHPDDQRNDHFEALSSDLEGQIAHSAVQRMAEIHPLTARDWLDDKFSNYLDDGQKSFLSSYIGAQEMAQGADRSAAQQMQARQSADQSAAAALSHAMGLYDQNTDSVQFPPGWASRLTANPNVGWEDKGALMHLYGRLQANGDAPASDPYQINQTLQHIASGGTVSHAGLIDSAGTSLRLADALHLSAAAGPLTTEERAHYGNLADTVQQARDALYGRDGENGAAGSKAWGRFVNWVMPAARAGGVDFGDPEGHPLNQLPRFRPSGNDLIEPPPEGRPSLKDIFGR